jgi:hypothetical protein
VKESYGAGDRKLPSTFNICSAIQELFRAQELLALKKGDDVTVKAKRQAFIYRQIRPKNSQRKLAAGWSKCWQERPVASMLESSTHLLLKQIAMLSYTKWSLVTQDISEEKSCMRRGATTENRNRYC